MKKAILAIFAIPVIFSCNKNQDKNQNDEKGSLYSSRMRESDLEGLNVEGIRIYNELLNSDEEVTLTYTSNFGSTIAGSSKGINLWGKTSGNLGITINGQNFPVNDNGQRTYSNANNSFDNLYGNVVNVALSEGNTVINKSLYLPTPIQATKLGNSELEISRTGNTIQWNLDNQNPTGKIILYYRLLSSDVLADYQSMISSDYIVIDDDGSYNIDNLIKNTNIKRINFILTRGNTVSLSYNGVNKIFGLVSNDHHEYIIR